MNDGREYVNIAEAAEMLGVNRRRVWQMIRDGQLEAIVNPVDRRERIIPRSQVEELMRFAKKGAA